MFLEINKDSQRRKGWIEVICGSMFSGKTEELLRRLRRAKIAKQKVEIFKPDIDIRFDETQVVSHDQNKINSTPVPLSSHILLLANNVDVVGIDEAQFFDDELPRICKELADNGVRVIIAGLDMDYTGKPFGPMPALLAMAEYITKVHAICMICGDLAHISHRIVDNKSQVMVGEKESYIPLCRSCFNKKLKQAEEA